MSINVVVDDDATFVFAVIRLRSSVNMTNLTLTALTALTLPPCKDTLSPLCGFVKVIFDAKYGEWLGAHMIGAGVTDMIAEVVVARNLETTGHEIIKSVHPHPTMSEAVMEAAAAAYDEVIHL